MKKTIKMLAMSAFCVVLAGAPAFAEGETNNDPTCARSSVTVSVELDQTWKNALNNNEDAIEVFEQLLAGGLVFDSANNGLRVTEVGRSPFSYPVLYSYNGTNIDSSQPELYFKVGTATEMTVIASFPQQMPLQYGYLHFEVNENASPVDFVLLKQGENFMEMKQIMWVDGVPRGLNESDVLSGNTSPVSKMMGTIGAAYAFDRDGYGLRGWTINERILDVAKTSAALSSDTNNRGIGHGDVVSVLATVLNSMSQKGLLYFDAYPAYAAECSANTIPSEAECDANIADPSAICSLTITRGGSVSYTNGCCPGFNLADSTATE